MSGVCWMQAPKQAQAEGPCSGAPFFQPPAHLDRALGLPHGRLHKLLLQRRQRAAAAEQHVQGCEPHRERLVCWHCAQRLQRDALQVPLRRPAALRACRCGLLRGRRPLVLLAAAAATLARRLLLLLLRLGGGKLVGG